MLKYPGNKEGHDIRLTVSNSETVNIPLFSPVGEDCGIARVLWHPLLLFFGGAYHR